LFPKKNVFILTGFNFFRLQSPSRKGGAMATARRASVLFRQAQILAGSK
jgi:hypothetical protein